MPIKKSELYSRLWQSCDELRGGMDASEYKNYILVLLFIKYVSDKFAGQPYAEIKVPRGASFKDMVALKGNKDIGDLINKKIVGPLADANQLSDMPDFNDAAKLGSGKEMQERLTNLIAIFEDKAFDFSKNRADGDDILGDAYEYLMRHFATESGKSKGQFYTPAEVSRVIAKVLGIRSAKTSPNTTVYDPTCGSGSLLLKVAYEATTKVTLYGQEKESTTAGLARMNMILHGNAMATIYPGNTLTDPKGVAQAQRLLDELPNKIRDILGVMADVRLVKKAGKELIEIKVAAYPSPSSSRRAAQAPVGTCSSPRYQRGTAAREPCGLAPCPDSRCRGAAARQVATHSEGRGAGHLRPPDEDQMGQLQPQESHHPLQHRPGQEAARVP